MDPPSTHPATLLRDRFGLEVPEMAVPKANYAKAVRTGDLLYLSSHGATRDGRHEFAGRVGEEVTLEAAQAAARLVALNMLGTIEHYIGDLDHVARFVKLTVFVRCAPTFTSTPFVADGASDLLVGIFGSERGIHARAAVGVSALPFGGSVDIDGIVQVR